VDQDANQAFVWFQEGVLLDQDADQAFVGF
jgi:hypothetical protein